MTDHTAHALTTDEVRANAGKWTLAADVGLLAHLKQFSDEIIKKTEVTESSLNNLLDKVEETCTNFNNVSNQFLSLQNSQFLENRVYDDETPTEEKERPSQPVEETQQQTLEKYKEAVSIGLGVLDSHFEEVILLESSDSDEEASDSNPALVLRPKTQYTKPLPLTIGSAEWWADDNVGLGEFQENEDSEPEVTLSDSEPNVTRPQIVKRFIRNSSSSSASSIEEPVPPMKKPNIPAIITIPALDEPPVLPTNDEDDTEDMFKPVDDLFGYVQEQSLFGRKQKNMDDIFPSAPETIPAAGDNLFAKEDAGDPLVANAVNSKPVNRVSNAFTKELAAKLGTVAKNQEKSVENETIPEVKKVENKTAPLFGDFIPPVAKTRTLAAKPQVEKPAKPTGLFGEQDEDDDLFSGVSSRKVVKKEPSASRLFDDDEDDDLFGKKMDAVIVNKQRDSSAYESIGKPAAGAVSNLFSGLDDDLYDDNDLFAPKSVPKKFPSVKPPSNSSVNNSPMNNMDGVQTSTPDQHGTLAVPSDPNPPDDLFGSISRVANESRDQSQISDASHEDSQIAANPADVGMMNDDDSRDLGFIETSNLGEENVSKKDSPANWFHPQLSSTQAVGTSHETSGYKTGVESAGVDSRSDSKRLDKRFSSILEDSSPDKKSKEDDLFSVSKKSSNWRSEEDLFKSGKSVPIAQSRHVKIESDLFGSTDTDDLFSSKPKEKKSDDLLAAKSVTSWKPSSIFNDNEDDSCLFDDVKSKLPDNKSVSSSRSSLFEEPGRSNLPGIFENKAEKAKLSLFDDVEDDFDLFGESGKKDVMKGRETVDDYHRSESATKHAEILPEKSFKEPSKPKPPSSLIVTKTSDLLKKPNAVLGEDLFAENDDNLFGGTSKSTDEKIAKLSIHLPSEETEKQDSSQVASNLLKDPGNDDDLFETSKTEPKPPSSLSVIKTSELLKNESADGTNQAVFKTVGKINDPSPNTAALLPGSRVISEVPKPAEAHTAEKSIESHLSQDPSSFSVLENNDNLFSETSTDPKITKPVASLRQRQEPPKPKPPSSLAVTKTSDLLKDEPDGEISRKVKNTEIFPDDLFGSTEPKNETNQAVSQKIGKLNIPSSLKINPSALLPGSRPVKTEATEAVDVNSVLTSAARDRPRIQVKRRPQTRKARHEALRHSGIDFGADDAEENFVSPASDSSLFLSVENSPSPAFVSAEVASPATDGEDCFSLPDSEEQNILTNDDGLLFGSATVISPGIAKKSQENIPKTSDNFKKPVSQEIESGDLFGASVSDSATSLFDDVKVPKKLNETVTKSLFGDDDDDDDDDIFSGKSAVVLSVKKYTVERVSEVSKSKNVEKKVKEPFVDPLGLLHE